MAVPIIFWPGPGPGAFGLAFYRICNISLFFSFWYLYNFYMSVYYGQYVDIAPHIKMLTRGLVGGYKALYVALQ